MLKVVLMWRKMAAVPGQHKKGLRLIGAYVDERLYARVKEAARENGKNVAEWLRELVRENVKPTKDERKGL